MKVHVVLGEKTAGRITLHDKEGRQAKHGPGERERPEIMAIKTNKLKMAHVTR